MEGKIQKYQKNCVVSREWRVTSKCVCSTSRWARYSDNRRRLQQLRESLSRTPDFAIAQIRGIKSHTRMNSGASTNGIIRSGFYLKYSRPILTHSTYLYKKANNIIVIWQRRISI